MVFRRRRAARKPRRKVPKRARLGRNRKAIIPRQLFATTQVANIKETVQFSYLNGNTPYGFNFSLQQFVRASQLAPNFKWYKAKFVEWSIEPLFNTFTDDGTPQSIPYMYMTMNRTQDSNGFTRDDMQAMGSKPQKLTTKKVIKYRPNWCSPGLISVNVDQNSYVREVSQNGLKPQYGYLACPIDQQSNPISVTSPDTISPIASQAPLDPSTAVVTTNTVVYNGHRIWLDQPLTGNTNVAVVTCTVHWEFRDPNCTYAPSPSVTVTPAVAK